MYVHSLVLTVDKFSRSQSKKLFSPASEEDNNMNFSMRTTPHGGKSSNRSVLKVYMANQLELNEAEMEEYEEVVNELAQQLEEVTKLKDELTVNIIHLHNEKADFIREKTEEWADEKNVLLSQIQLLEISEKETNSVISVTCL